MGKWQERRERREQAEIADAQARHEAHLRQTEHRNEAIAEMSLKSSLELEAEAIGCLVDANTLGTNNLQKPVLRERAIVLSNLAILRYMQEQAGDMPAPGESQIT